MGRETGAEEKGGWRGRKQERCAEIVDRRSKREAGVEIVER
jgi:hypothetical protein